MAYDLQFSDRAKKDLAKLKKNEPKLFAKAQNLLREMIYQPYSGLGKPEQLKYIGLWSRRIDKKHRICYNIDESTITIFIASISS